jgi:hypothetical protein
MSECKDYGNMKIRTAFFGLSIENFIVLVVLFSTAVATWTTFGNDINNQKTKDKEHEIRMEKIENTQEVVKQQVTETNLNIREMKIRQENLEDDVSDILKLLRQDHRND